MPGWVIAGVVFGLFSLIGAIRWGLHIRRIQRDFDRERAEIRERIDRGCRRTDGKIV